MSAECEAWWTIESGRDECLRRDDPEGPCWEACACVLLDALHGCEADDNTAVARALMPIGLTATCAALVPVLVCAEHAQSGDLPL